MDEALSSSCYNRDNQGIMVVVVILVDIYVVGEVLDVFGITIITAMVLIIGMIIIGVINVALTEIINIFGVIIMDVATIESKSNVQTIINSIIGHHLRIPKCYVGAIECYGGTNIHLIKQQGGGCTEYDGFNQIFDR